jgi:hypothetical protein
MHSLSPTTTQDILGRSMLITLLYRIFESDLHRIHSQLLGYHVKLGINCKRPKNPLKDRNAEVRGLFT